MRDDIHRQMMATCQGADSADMITVLVRNQECIKIIGAQTDFPQTPVDFTR